MQGTPITQDRWIGVRGGRSNRGPGRPVRRRIGHLADDLISRVLTPPEAAALQFQGVPVIGVLQSVSDTGDVRLEVLARRRETGTSSAEVSMDGDGRPGCR